MAVTAAQAKLGLIKTNLGCVCVQIAAAPGPFPLVHVQMILRNSTDLHSTQGMPGLNLHQGLGPFVSQLCQVSSSPADHAGCSHPQQNSFPICHLSHTFLANWTLVSHGPLVSPEPWNSRHTTSALGPSFAWSATETCETSDKWVLLFLVMWYPIEEDRWVQRIRDGRPFPKGSQVPKPEPYLDLQEGPEALSLPVLREGLSCPGDP